MVARAATTTDVFNAIAEPRRRQIIDLLADGERPVGDLVRSMRLGQPQVSKHLRVLRDVGAVDVRELGRQRLYRLSYRALKPVYDWIKDFEAGWSERSRDAGPLRQSAGPRRARPLHARGPDRRHGPAGADGKVHG